MGHVGGSVGRINSQGSNELVPVYARYEDAEPQVREVYIEAEPNLTIYGSTPKLYELREEVSELNKVTKTKTEEVIEKSEFVQYLRRDVTQLKTLNRDLAQKLGEITSEIEQLKDRVDSFKQASQQGPQLLDESLTVEAYVERMEHFVRNWETIKAEITKK